MKFCNADQPGCIPNSGSTWSQRELVVKNVSLKSSIRLKITRPFFNLHAADYNEGANCSSSDASSALKERRRLVVEAIVGGAVMWLTICLTIDTKHVISVKEATCIFDTKNAIQREHEFLRIFS